MTDDRFDDLTRRLATGTSRRGVLKGGLALALGGMAARLRGDSAEARARVKMACARLGQPCDTWPGTPGNQICCPHLVCDTDLTCCKPEGESCIGDGDCCTGNVCRPNPTGLGNHCLPPGDFGAKCVDDADCLGNLVCDPATNTCLAIAGAPCTANDECVSGVCDIYTGVCLAPCLAEVIFDSTPHPFVSSLPSLGYQATQTAEFGDYVSFAGTSRTADTVIVSMNTWASQSDWPLLTDPAGWTHPIALNIYAADTSGANPALGALLGTMTQTFPIPWRPAADPTCVSPTSWRNPADNTCYTGFLFNITFDLSSLNLALPDAIIYGIVYDTETFGPAPIGSAGPYNSLNVGLLTTAPSVGTDVESDAALWNTATASNYTDSGTGGVSIFRRDTGWTPYRPAVQFNAKC